MKTSTCIHMSSTWLELEDIKNSVRRAVVQYFGDINMIKHKQTPLMASGKTYSTYYARLSCLTFREDKFLVAITEGDGRALGSKLHLSELLWVSFQTRVFELHPLRLEAQQTNRVTTSLMETPIKLINITRDRYVYLPVNDLPLRVELLKEGKAIYSSRGTLQTAMDTFRCVLVLV